MASAIHLPKLSVPSGGGTVRGLGEGYTPDEFTGAATFQVPLLATACRDVTPKLSLSYATGSGNSAFGLGFDLALPRISRRTDTCIPRYDDTDEFVVGGGEVLVVSLMQVGSEWQPIVDERTDGGATYRVTRFRTRVDTDYARYERWCRLSDNDEHWRVIDVAGGISVLGASDASRIVDSDAHTHVFSWLIEHSTTMSGDRVLYEYKSENGDNVPTLPSNAGRDDRANKYIACIRYGMYTDAAGDETYAFNLVFDYGEYDIDAGNADPFMPKHSWSARPDPFSSYRSGFEIRTYRLCRGVLMFHTLPALGSLPCLVGVSTLSHTLLAGLSMVQTVGYVGYRRKDNGIYDTLAVPDIRLDYQPFVPEKQIFQPVTPQRGVFPAPLAQGALLTVDLLGEGLPGLLFSNTNVCTFWRNLGAGRFAAPALPTAMPIQHDFSSGRQLLTSLQGNGQLDCVVTDAAQAGYYRYSDADGWAAFLPFSQWAPEAQSDAAQFADLSGDGLSDLLVMQAQRLRWYPCEGDDGYGLPVELPIPTDLPDPRKTSAKELVSFADPFGDGGTHLLRVRNGSVECWPSLGYGHFGKRVLFDHAPQFPGGLDSRRLLIADINGSGAADLLYFIDTRVLLYANQSGDGFADPVEIALPASYSQLSYTGTADLLGNGGQNLLLGTQDQGQWLIDFTGGHRPWLLASITKALGGQTRLSYTSSTHFALADALAERPWPTSLPFPVQVLTSVEINDPFSGAVQVTRMAYHDGYYDPVDKAFRGFGQVERWVDETIDGEIYSPTGYTRAWYDTGAFEGGAALSLQYAHDYWHGIDGMQPSLADSAIDTLQDPPDARLLHNAHRALKGRPLRRESYGLDGSPSQYVPTSVSSYSYTLREMQPGRVGVSAVFQVSARETMDAVYERDASDPRISQQFDLSIDAFGHVLLSAVVAYQRGANTAKNIQTQPACQSQTLIRATEQSYAIASDGAYLPSQLAQETTYQLGQLTPDNNGWFTFASVNAQVTNALSNVIPPEQPFSGTQPQARLQLTTRYCYWDALQSAPLAYGEVVMPPLLHHQEATRLSIGMVTSSYGKRLDDQQLRDNGLLTLDSNYWWASGDIFRYTPKTKFYCVVSTTDAASTLRSVTYDAYTLAVLSATTPDGTSTATPDYQTMQAVTLVDVNGVMAQVLPDALGRVVVTTQYHAPTGGARQGDGDITDYKPLATTDLYDVLARPADYLQQMSAYFFYDFQTGSGQPPVVLSVARQFHVSQLTNGETSPLRLVVTYGDTQGNTLENKTAVETAACGINDCWLSRERQQFNLQSIAIRRWNPAFTTSPSFSGYQSGWHDTSWLDAQSRVIRVLTAKGFLSRSAFHAWCIDQWDLNDTVTTSPYYQAHINDTSPAFASERRALMQAALFEDTYTTQWLDPLGRNADIEQRNLSSDNAQIYSMTTSSVLDLDGRAIAMADPRFTAANQNGTTLRYNILTTYDLVGNAIVIDSVDAGTSLAFYDALGRLAQQWDARQVHACRNYDAMGRLTDIYVDGALGLQQVVERLTYGTDAVSNSIGRRVTLRDESGLTTDGPFDLEGEPLSSSFQLRVDYVDEVDWSLGKNVALEPALVSSGWRDAFGQLVQKCFVDGSAQHYCYYTVGWPASSELTLPNATAQSVLDNAIYNADGNRTSATLGQGIPAIRRYEDSTGRLIGIDTMRTSDGKVLQKIQYTYDPMGNVASSQDATVPLVFCNQSQIGPGQDYVYDAIYRLSSATGRENPAITATTYRDGFKQSVYIPLCPSNPSDGTKLVPYNETYRYDDSGNLVTLTHSTPLSGLSWSRDYTVSKTSNRVVLDTDPSDPDAAYDANGNMDAFEQLRSMTWDWRNRARCATVIERAGSDNDAQYYIYNAAGTRVRRVTQRMTAGGLQVEDKVYVDGCELIRSLPVSDSPNIEYTGLSVSDAAGRLLMLYHWPENLGRAPQWRYQLATVTGSAALELEADGAIISYEEYFPYGGTSIIAGNAQTDVALKYHRFCGKECDDVTGLYDFGERYYVTWLARWLSTDPKGPIDSLNLYQYVGCNPLSFVDPTGGCKIKVTVPSGSGFTGSGGSSDFSSFETSYHYLSSSTAKGYEQLTLDLHTYVYKYNPKALSVSTERLPAKLEQQLMNMFEAHRDLHIASNPSLLDVFQTAQENANVDDDTGSVKSYTKMRSPYFTRAMNDTDMGDIVSQPDFYRTVELHHGTKKALRPEYATHSGNLWALTRGGYSYGEVGQHEGAFHLVGAGGFGNRYTTEVAAYSGLIMHWEGLEKLPGRPPGEPVGTYTMPAPVPAFGFPINNGLVNSPPPTVTVPIWNAYRPSGTTGPRSYIY